MSGLADEAERALLALRDRLQADDVTEQDLRAALVCVTDAYDALVAQFCDKPRDYAHPRHCEMFDAWNVLGSTGHHLWLHTATKPKDG